MSETGKRIFLANGASIELSNEKMLFWGCNGKWIRAAGHTEMQFLSYLLKHPGKTIPYDTLYNSYPNKGAKCGAASALTKERSRLPQDIKENVKNEYGCGYRLLLQQEQTAEPPAEKETPTGIIGDIGDLLGEYYGFYLDPTGQLTGAYLHIQEDAEGCGCKMNADGIFGLRSDELMQKVPQVFHGEAPYAEQFKKFKEALTGPQRKCFFASGELREFDQHVVAITLAREHIDRWNIVINIKDFMLDPRPRDCDRNLYRGGMAMMIGCWTKSGIVAYRIAFVRKSWFNPKIMTLQSQDLKDMLISNGFVNVDEKADKELYQWIVEYGTDF